MLRVFSAAILHRISSLLVSFTYFCQGHSKHYTFSGEVKGVDHSGAHGWGWPTKNSCRLEEIIKESPDQYSLRGDRIHIHVPDSDSVKVKEDSKAKFTITALHMDL